MESQPNGSSEVRRPRLTGVAVVQLAIASVFLAMLATTWADPDLWGHLRFGADIIAARSIPERDPYSFASAPTWVNQSWLADVLMYVAFALGGTAGLVGMKLVVACGIVGVVVWMLHGAGVRRPWLELLLFLCLAALYPSLPVFRPQLFSLLLFAIMLALLARHETRVAARLLALPFVMALWANVHGAWLTGLGALGLWLAAEIVTCDGGWRHRAYLAGIGGLAAVATIATPYGVDLWRQLWTATGGDSLRDVTEWRGLLETGSPALAIWCALVGLAAFTTWAAGGRTSRVLVLALLAYGSWHVRRLLPYFGLATTILLAPQLAAMSRRSASRRPHSGRMDPKLVTALVTIALALCVLSAWRTARAFACLRMDHSREADVRGAAFIAQNQLHGRLLVYSDWGVYAIWHFAPSLQVSIDGRREFAYTLSEIARHNAIYRNAPTAPDDVEALRPDYIWLPAQLPVLSTLERRGWHRVFESQRSTVLARAPATDFRPSPERPLPACFPADPL